MKFMNQEVSTTSLLAVTIAAKVGGDIVTQLAGNDLSAAVGEREVGGEMAYSSIAANIAAVHHRSGYSDNIAEKPTTNTEVLFQDAGKLAIMLQMENKCFIPKPHTVLSTLTQPLSNSAYSGSVELGDYLNNPYTLNNINSAVDVGVRAVGSLVSVCRNQVLPIVRDILTTAQQYVNDHQRKTAFPFTIVSEDLPALWNDSSFIAGLTRADVDGVNTARVVPLMGITNNEIAPATMLLTGVSHLDDIIRDTLFNSTIDSDWLWKQLKRQGNKPLHQILVHDDTGIITSTNRRVYLTVAYLLVRHIMAVGVDTLKPSEPVLAKEYFTGMLRDLGVAIIRSKKLYEQLGTSDKIVTNTTKEDGITQIHVHGSVYKKWLTMDATNTPELLFSAVNLYGTSIDIKKVDEDRKRIAANWSRLFAFGENQRLAKEREFVNNAIDYAVRCYLPNMNTNNDITPEHAEGLVLSIKKKLPGMIAALKVNTLDDLPRGVRDIVTQLFFADTDACNYLCIYDRLGAENTTYDPRTVATLATFEYVGKWVAYQLYIDNL